jgi:hypothetical protein
VIATGKVDLRQVDRARMDKGLCDAIGTPGSMRRGSLLAIAVECIGVDRSRRDHRDHHETSASKERRGVCKNERIERRDEIIVEED